MAGIYEVPAALTVLACIFLGLGAVLMLIVAGDIVKRQGWKDMMWIMIPVYPINAGYMPISLYVYFKYGRPSKPTKPSSDGKSNAESDPKDGHTCNNQQAVITGPQEIREMSSGYSCPSGQHQQQASESEESPEAGEDAGCHMRDSSNRPMWATIVTGVCHCGAGCVLGDLVGEWIVWSADVRISGHHIWPELLIDYAFALLFGIMFQYFSIAPMSGEWGPKTLWRAFKADVLSLTSFEVGLFGWMVIYQVTIWDYQLEMDNWTYWWMMQVGMFLGFFTATPINWWLIVKRIKEPCA